LAETQAAGAPCRSDESSAALLRAVDEADFVIVSFPLYVDQLPAPLSAALERIADDRRLRPARKSSRLMAVDQRGFPESLQNLPAVEIMRRFAKETGFSWAGGNVPSEASTLMARPLFPRWLYRSMANRGMKREARKHGAKRTVPARLYGSAAPDGES
jgi:hypothetical protein